MVFEFVVIFKRSHPVCFCLKFMLSADTSGIFDYSQSPEYWNIDGKAETFIHFI